MDFFPEGALRKSKPTFLWSHNPVILSMLFALQMLEVEWVVIAERGECALNARNSEWHISVCSRSPHMDVGRGAKQPSA